VIPIIRELFSDHNDQQFAVRMQCCSCVAHRLLKVGWENGLNYYDARNLILVGMYLPVHCRPRIVDEAHQKALDTGDQRVLAWIANLYAMGAAEHHAKQQAGAA
jgi:hypothetical protein